MITSRYRHFAIIVGSAVVLSCSHKPEQASQTRKPAEAPAPTPAPVPKAPYTGFVDHTNCKVIDGWVMKTAAPEDPVDVDIFDGEAKIGSAKADLFRADLVGIGNAKHAFTFATPAALKDGKSHMIHVKTAEGEFGLIAIQTKLGPCQGK